MINILPKVEDIYVTPYVFLSTKLIFMVCFHHCFLNNSLNKMKYVLLTIGLYSPWQPIRFCSIALDLFYPPFIIVLLKIEFVLCTYTPFLFFSNIIYVQSTLSLLWMNIQLCKPKLGLVYGNPNRMVVMEGHYNSRKVRETYQLTWKLDCQIECPS